MNHIKFPFMDPRFISLPSFPDFRPLPPTQCRSVHHNNISSIMFAQEQLLATDPLSRRRWSLLNAAGVDQFIIAFQAAIIGSVEESHREVKSLQGNGSRMLVITGVVLNICPPSNINRVVYLRMRVS